MAVAAYASLVSLMQDIDNIQQLHASQRLILDEKHVLQFQQKVEVFQKFLEDRSQTLSPETDTLIREIPAAVAEIESLIDMEVVGQFNGSCDGLLYLRQSLDKMITKLEFITKELLVVNQENSYHADFSSSTTKSIGKTSVVGFEQHVDWFIPKLTNSQEKSLQVFPIVGMGGIGKTTLAQCIFENPSIKNRFDVRIWCTISQKFDVLQILSQLLQDETAKGNQSELGLRLHQQLHSRRYFIILDDVWTCDAWDQVIQHIPKKLTGSRIIVTTRMSTVAKYINSYKPYNLSLLDEDTSWDLLRETIFRGGDCPNELLEIGKQIAKSCCGLPISLSTIGGLLHKSNLSVQYFENVAKNVTKVAGSGDDEHCLKILSLSYNFLHIHLKPCFLYFAVFPDEKQVKVTDLIRFWGAQGLVKPIAGKLFDDVVEDYLNDLIDRNLIIIHRMNLHGRVSYCRIHDLLRELCFREMNKENLLAIAAPRLQKCPDNLMLVAKKCIFCDEIVSGIVNNESFSVFLLGSMSGTDIRVCKHCRIKYPYLGRSSFVNLICIKCGTDFCEHSLPIATTLRHIEVSSTLFRSPSPLNYLWNLQFLVFRNIISKEQAFPAEIWEMQQLRHLIFKTCTVPEPNARSSDEKNTMVLNQLQRLTIMSPNWSKEITKRIPNLKKLKLVCLNDIESYSFDNLKDFNQLDSFHIEVFSGTFSLNSIKFPQSLKRLCLVGLHHFDWNEMTKVGSLPNLEFLKLVGMFGGSDGVWNPDDGEFCELKVLIITDTDLRIWEANDSHFPKLEMLLLNRATYLEIPLAVGDIPTLRSIRLRRCDAITIKTVQELHKQQVDYGNTSLEVYNAEKLMKVSNEISGDKGLVEYLHLFFTSICKCFIGVDEQ